MNANHAATAQSRHLPPPVKDGDSLNFRTRPRVHKKEPAPTPEHDVWTTAEVARYLRCSVRLVAVQAELGEIKGRKIGVGKKNSAWRFNRRDIIGLI